MNKYNIIRLGYCNAGGDYPNEIMDTVYAKNEFDALLYYNNSKNLDKNMYIINNELCQPIIAEQI